jgi:hypothetical protein
MGRKLARLPVLAALMAAACASGRAEAATVFTASGTFTNGATLSGTVTIDETSGSATAADLLVRVDSATSYTFDEIFEQGVQPLSESYDLSFKRPGPDNFPFMRFFLPVSTLVGYQGGALASTSAPVPSSGLGDLISFYHVNNIIADGNLTSGSMIALTAAVPEPATLISALGGVALVGLGLAWRRGRSAV